MTRIGPSRLPFRVVWRTTRMVRNEEFASLERAKQYAALVEAHNAANLLSVAVERWTGSRWTTVT